MIDRLENLAFNACALAEIVTKLVILAPVGAVIVSIEVAGELRRRAVGGWRRFR